MGLMDDLRDLLPTTVWWQQNTGPSDFPGQGTYASPGTAIRCRRRTQGIDLPGPNGMVTTQREVLYLDAVYGVSTRDRFKLDDGRVVAVATVDRFPDETGPVFERVTCGGEGLRPGP